MPAPLVIDREAVKTLAVAVGVREAARQLGLNEDTVSAWSARDKWFAEPERPATMGRASGASKTPSAAMADAINENTTRARDFLARAALKGAKAFERLPGEKLTERDTSGAFRNVTAAASQIGGWDRDDAGRTNVTVNVGLLG